MKAEVRHHRRNDRAARELPAALHVRAADGKHLVAVDNAALLVDVDPEVIIKRLTERRCCKECGYIGTAADATCPKCDGEMYQRDDDNEATVRNRLDVYAKSTSPLIDYYKGKGLLKSVDGDRPVDTVYVDVKALLGL